MACALHEAGCNRPFRIISEGCGLDYLARKFTPAKWAADKIPKGETVSADAVTADLRTTNNALSIWACAPDEHDVKEVALAFASTINHPDKICLILLHRPELEALGIRMSQTAGETLVLDLLPRHHDLIELGLARLSRLAEHIADLTRQDKHCYIFTKEQFCKIVCNAIGANRLSLDDLKDEFRKEIWKKLSESALPD